MPSPDSAAPAVIRFWFDEVGPERWFARDEQLDAEIRKRFSALRDHVFAARAEGWRESPEHLLAAILLLDQFSRNIHRGSRRAFEADPLALELARLALDRGWSHDCPEEWRQFLLMPLMHSENLDDQRRSVAEFKHLGNDEPTRFAQLHLDQIERFGRFPGRNAAMGRVSTPEEREVIDRGETF